MTTTGLPSSDLNEVRRRTLIWAQEHGKTYADIARQAHLSRDQVKHFITGISGTEGVAANLIAYLPLELVYEPSRVSPA